MPSIYEIRDYLGDEQYRRFTRCARLEGKARVGFRPDEWQPYRPYPKSHTPFAPLVTVVEERSDAAWRIIYENWGLRLLLWVHAEDVLTVVREPVLVKLEPAPRALSGDLVTGVEVQPGCLLDQLDSTALWTEVYGGDWRFDFAGWIPSDALGKTCVAPDRSLMKANARIRTRADVALYESTRGGLLGTFRNNHRQHSIRVVGRPTRGMAPVRYQGEDFEVTGFMERVHILPDPDAPTGYAHIAPFPRHEALMLLPEGTCLYDDKGGEPVGVVLRDVHNVVESVKDGWWHIPHLWIGWRTFDVWVQDDGPAPHRLGSPDNRTIYRNLQRCEP